MLEPTLFPTLAVPLHKIDTICHKNTGRRDCRVPELLELSNDDRLLGVMPYHSDDVLKLFTFEVCFHGVV